MELSKQIQEEINQRQNGMCGHCGRLIDEIEGVQREFIALNSKDIEQPSLEKCVQICNYCTEEVKNLMSDANYDLKKYNFTYAGFNEYSAENKLDDFRQEIDSAIEFVNNSKDIKASKNIINEKIKTLRSLGFDKEIYDDFNSKLFAKLNELFDLQKEEYAKIEVVQKENYENIKNKLDSVYNNLSNPELQWDSIKEIREDLIKIQNEMNSLNLNRENKDSLVAKFSESFNILSQKQSDDREKYEMECSENYLNLKSKVDEVFDFAANHPIFKESRRRLIEVQGMFKGLTLKKDNREELFNKIQQAFTDLNAKQDAEREGYGIEADENYEKIKPVIVEAISIADNSTNFKQARTELVDAQGSLRVLKLKKEQREELYGLIREAFDRLNARQSEERGIYEKETNQNNASIIEKLDEVEKDLNNDPEFNKIRDMLISIQSEVKLLNLKREQRNNAFTKIRELFSILDEKRKNYRLNKINQKHNRLNSIKSNLSSRLHRIEESISWDYKSLNFQKEKLANLIDNEEQKIIDDINAKIQMHNERIVEKENNINELKTRLEEIEKELENIDKQDKEQPIKNTAINPENSTISDNNEVVAENPNSDEKIINSDENIPAQNENPAEN